jgi:hypothetical protein
MPNTALHLTSGRDAALGRRGWTFRVSETLGLS